MAASERIAYIVHAPAPTAANHAVAAQQRQAVDEAMRTVQRLLDHLSPVELATLFEAVEQAFDAPPPSPEHAALIAELADGDLPAPEERATLALAARARAFRLRQELLEGSLTAPEVAQLLGTSRQTPHDRARRNALLAVPDRGMMHFPAWQFDANSADGVVPGLPAVLRALRTSPLGKASWLTRPNPFLGGQAPIAALRGGAADHVQALARTVGVS